MGGIESELFEERWKKFILFLAWRLHINEDNLCFQ